MFWGHFAVALAARRAAPATSPGTLVLAAQVADLAWPVLLPACVEAARIQAGATVLTPLLSDHYPTCGTAAAAPVGVSARGLRSRR